MTSTFRNLVPALDTPRLVQARTLTAREFGSAVRAVPGAKAMIGGWEARIAEPFQGITCDGHPIASLYSRVDEEAPTEAMIAAAQRLLHGLDEPRRAKVRYAVDGPEWRRWSNPEFLVNDLGLRLEDHEPAVRDLVMDLVATSLNERGYAKARDRMRMNGFLGELSQLPRVLNAWSYNFLLFGEPSREQP